VVPFLALVALAALCFARLVAQPASLIVDPERPSIDRANPGEPRGVGNDATFLFLPHHLWVGRAIRAFGHLPQWDDRGFGGRPLAGNPQAGMFYPPVWLVWWSCAPAGLGWLTVGHLLWGGIGTYVLVRSFPTSRWGATIAAATYQASPLLLAHTFEGHYPHVWAACWYPWAFWAVRQARAGRLRGQILLPVILAVTSLTGHPQEWFLLVLALVAWGLFDLWRTWRARGPRCGLVNLLGWAGMLALSIGLTAVEFAPELAARPWLAHGADAAAGVDIPRRYHLWALNAFQLLSPTALGGPSDFFGDDNYWETLFSIGLVPLVLAIVAAFRYPDRAMARGWLVLGSLAIWFACGRHLLLYALAYLTVPGMSWFRVPARALFLANLAGAVLAGLGVETLRTRSAHPPIWRGLAIRFVGILGLALACLLVIRQIQRGDASSRMAAAAARVLHDDCFWLIVGGITALIGIGCLARGWRARRLAGGLFGLLAICELGWYGFSLLQVAPAERFLDGDPIGAALDRIERDQTRTDRPRIKARDSFYSDLQAASVGVEKTNINDVFQLQHAAWLYELLYPVASRPRRRLDEPMCEAVDLFRRQVRQAVFDRLSVRYLVSDRFESDPGWPVAAHGNRRGSHWLIQQNTTALPRAYVVPTALVVHESEHLTIARFREAQPRDLVVMDFDPLDRVPKGQRQPFTAAEWASVDPDRPVLRVTVQAPGLLVLADTWMPGWTARVNGVVTPIYRGNVAQRVVPLWQPGRQTIAFNYRSPGFALGCTITGLSLLIWGLWCVFLVQTRSKTVRAYRRAGKYPLAHHRACRLVACRLLENPALDLGQGMYGDEGRVVEFLGDVQHLADLEPRHDAQQNLLVHAAHPSAPLIDCDAAPQSTGDRLPDGRAALGDDGDGGILLEAVKQKVQRLRG